MLDRARHGPWAVVAGGSEGVGAAFARRLAAAGLDLVLVARRPEPLAATARAAEALGVQVRTVAVDLTAPDAPAAVRAAADDVDVGLLVYNAGANTYRSAFVDGEPDGIRRVIDLNVTARLALVGHFGARMRDRGAGGVVMLGSVSGFVGHERISIYAAAKAFGRIFAEGLWLELAPHGVDVLELVIGLTRTPAMERAGLRLDLPGRPAADPDAVAQEGLDHLGDGPVWVASGHLAAVQEDGAFPRDRAVRANAERLRALLGS